MDYIPCHRECGALGLAGGKECKIKTVNGKWFGGLALEQSDLRGKCSNHLLSLGGARPSGGGHNTLNYKELQCFLSKVFFLQVSLWKSITDSCLHLLAGISVAFLIWSNHCSIVDTSRDSAFPSWKSSVPPTRKAQQEQGRKRYVMLLFYNKGCLLQGFRLEIPDSDTTLEAEYSHRR